MMIELLVQVGVLLAFLILYIHLHYTFGYVPYDYKDKLIKAIAAEIVCVVLPGSLVISLILSKPFLAVLIGSTIGWVIGASLARMVHEIRSR